ncbi:MAG: hypothetical protein KA124_07255, partial [Luteimonas sp.]|nr:hypothetical protein [Luteimonas sp.]
VWLQFDSVQASDDARRYRIRVGDGTRVVDAATLRRQPVGPFALPAAKGGSVPVTVALADPAYPAEDLGLRFDTATVSTTPAPPP